MKRPINIGFKDDTINSTSLSQFFKKNLPCLYLPRKYFKYRFRLCLVWFSGISTIVGYLMPNPFLYVLTVLFQTIQFSKSTQLSSIGPIDRTLSGATSAGRSGPGSDGDKGVLASPKATALLEPNPIRLFNVISRTLVGGILPLSRNAVGIFERERERERESECLWDVRWSDRIFKVIQDT